MRDSDLVSSRDVFIRCKACAHLARSCAPAVKTCETCRALMHINVTARRVLRVLGRKCVCGTLVWTLVLVPTHRFSWSSRKKCQHGANATKRRGSRWSLGASCWMYLFART